MDKETGNISEIEKHFHQAVIAYKKKNYHEAILNWQKITNNTDGDREILIKATMNLANTRYMLAKKELKQGNIQKAVELLKQYNQYYPGDKKSAKILFRLKKILNMTEKTNLTFNKIKELRKKGDWIKISRELLDFHKTLMGAEIDA